MRTCYVFPTTSSRQTQTEFKTNLSSSTKRSFSWTSTCSSFPLQRLIRFLKTIKTCLLMRSLQVHGRRRRSAKRICHRLQKDLLAGLRLVVLTLCVAAGPDPHAGTAAGTAAARCVDELVEVAVALAAIRSSARAAKPVLTHRHLLLLHIHLLLDGVQLLLLLRLLVALQRELVVQVHVRVLRLYLTQMHLSKI